MKNQKPAAKKEVEATIATKDDILKTKKRLTIELVPIESLDGQKVRIAKMNVLLSDVYEGSLVKISTNGKGEAIITPEITRLKSKLVAATLVGGDGKPLLTLEEIDELDPEVIHEIYKHSERLNGKGQAVEDLAKNSDATQTDGSSSD